MGWFTGTVDSVYLRELEEEEDREERLVLTGLFDGDLHSRDHIAGLPFDEALAWARERAALIYVDAEDGRFSAGTERAVHVPELSAETAARVRMGRRRPLVDWWLDRTEADVPIRFEIEVALVPGELDSEHRAERERVIEIARTTGREPHEEGAEDIDGRWALEVDVHPPGYERPPLPD